MSFCAAYLGLRPPAADCDPGHHNAAIQAATWRQDATATAHGGKMPPPQVRAGDIRVSSVGKKARQRAIFSRARGDIFGRRLAGGRGGGRK